MYKLFTKTLTPAPLPEGEGVLQLPLSLTSILDNFFFNLLKNLSFLIASRRRRRGNPENCYYF
ncbi:MAG: hypothetical protein WCJ33_10015, partial [Pseudomonadota bacterium]